MKSPKRSGAGPFTMHRKYKHKRGEILSPNHQPSDTMKNINNLDVPPNYLAVTDQFKKLFDLQEQTVMN
jgi:hypothetical protein